MILVTLGTQDKKFYRLLESLQKQIDRGLIKDKIVVQAGCSSDFKTNSMEIFNLIPIDQFEQLIKECDILITHGGVGSILSGLKNNKKVIAIPRLSKYGEHVNDHQLQIVNNFSESGYIMTVDNIDELYKVIDSISSFKSKKFKSNNKKFVDCLKQEIDKYL